MPKRLQLVALLAASALLTAPVPALARKPLISYVDAQGKFQLYDAETGANVSPAPPVPVPANHAVNQFSWATSPEGRYIVFNDQNKKLYLLDRLTNQPTPLPGTPSNLTVSNTGLVAYDNNSNKPTYVYDSVAKKPFATGLDPDPANPTNELRQPRFSGDGNFLVGTCFDDNMTACFTTGDSDSDVFVQNLVTRQQVKDFPDEPMNNGKDEEHPCINNDGTLIALEKPNPTQKDIFLYRRNGNAFSAVATPGLNDPANDDRFCQLSPGGDFVSDIQNNKYKLYERSSASFVTLPNLPFDARSTLSAPYTRPANPPSQVTVTSFSMTNARFRVGKRPTAVNARKRKSVRRGSAFLYSLSAAGKVRIDIYRKQLGRKAGKTCRKATRKTRKRKRCVRLVLKGSLTRNGAAGSNRTAFSGRIGRRALKRGKYVANVTAANVKGASFTIVG